jgi:hypothetical protein
MQTLFGGLQAPANSLRKLGRFVVTRVVGSRPEEAAQSISATTRDHVNVKVRHALTHPVIHRYE